MKTALTDQKPEAWRKNTIKALKSTFLLLSTTFIWTRGLSFLSIALATFYFSVEDIAAYALWIGISSLVSVFATGRLEQQFPAGQREDMPNLFFGTITLAIVTALLASLIGFLLSVEVFWHYVGFAVLLRSLQSVFSLWSVRVRKIRVNALGFAFEAVARFAFIVLMCMGGFVQVWILPLLDIVALLIYGVFMTVSLPLPKRTLGIPFSEKLISRYGKVSAYNACSAVSEYLLVNFPVFMAAIAASPSIVAAIFLIHRMGEMARSLISATLSQSLFRQMVLLRNYKNNYALSMSRRRVTVKRVFLITLALDTAQFAAILIGLIVAIPFLPPLWQTALQWFPFLSGFYFFLALVGPLFRLFTVDRREDLSFLFNGLSVVLAFLLFVSLSHSLTTLKTGLVGLTLIAFCRAIGVLWVEMNVSKQ